MKYVDFDLVLAPCEQGYRAQVLNSPAGQGTADFQLPFSEQELKIFRLESQARRGVRRMESSESERPENLEGDSSRPCSRERSRTAFPRASRGPRADAELEGQEFKSFQVSPDGSRAQVGVVEQWSVEFHSRLNGACMTEIPSYEMSHAYFPQRAGQGWSIYSIQHHNQAPPPQPCRN